MHERDRELQASACESSRPLTRLSAPPPEDVDRPLPPRSAFQIVFRRYGLPAIVLSTIVFGVGMLPVLFLYVGTYWLEEPDPAAGIGLSTPLPPSVGPVPQPFSAGGGPGSDFARQAILEGVDRNLAAHPTGVAAFVGVNVISMRDDSVARDRTVVVRDGRIEAVGPASEVTIPAGARRVDGRGRYLLPGLMDLHVHLTSDASDNHAQLLLHAARGVTTVLNQRGAPEHLVLRSRLQGGLMVGPTLVSTGPFINEPGFATPAAVTREVERQARLGYDFVKLHGDLSLAAYTALVESSRRQGLPLVGHAPRNLGVDPMIELGQHAVAHAEEYLYAFFFRQPGMPARDSGLDEWSRFLREQEALIPELARRTAAAGTWVVPNLTAYRGIMHQAADIGPVMARREVRYVPSRIVVDWTPQNNTYVRRFARPGIPERFRAQYRLLERLVAGFREAGVPMLAGTDAPIPAVVPGFALHDELQNLVEAGLTPFEALRTATTAGADFLGLDDRGLVAAGLRADLLLVEANPLDDIDHTRRIVAVMIGGRLLESADLESLLEDLRRYASL